MSTQWLMDSGWALSALEGLWRASWQGALWAAAVWALTRALPRMPSALRAGLWWLVTLKFVVSLGGLAPVRLPLLPAPAPVQEATSPEPPSTVPVTVVTVGTVSAPLPSEGNIPWRPVGLAALLALWGLGIAWQVRSHLRAWATMRHLRRHALPLRHPALEDTLRELAATAGLLQVPRLMVSEAVASPLATGLLSPVVVLPAKAVRRLDVDALRMALAHELAHFQRRDLWLGWVPAIAETVFFFHPLVRKAAREYALAREEACDAEALRLTGAEPGDYGQLLLSFGVTRPHGTAAALGASAHLHALHRRLTMLEHVDVSSPRRRAPLRAALLVLGLAALVPFQVVAREPSVAAPKPVPPAPPAPPAVAPPPAPPMIAMAADERGTGNDGERYLIISGNTMMGSMSDLRMVKALRGENGKDVLFFERNGQGYVIRDPETLKQARAAFEPQAKLGAQQAELGKKQAALGVKQAELGQKQGALGRKQAELGLKQAELSLQVARAAMQGDTAEAERKERELEKSRQTLNKEMEALSQQQEALGREQAALGNQQAALGSEQGKLGAQMESLSREAEKKLKSLIDEAVRKGLAEPLKS